MMRICLMGRHSHRSPLGYAAYRQAASRTFAFVDAPTKADVLVFGFVIDLTECIDTIRRALDQQPNLRLVVLSEEPLWDTLWGGDFRRRVQDLVVMGELLHLNLLNHFTSEIFHFSRIPYFVTTDDRYFVRYQGLFQRNTGLSEDDIRSAWSSAPVKAAFYAEHRIGPQFDFHDPDLDIRGLCEFRTKVAQSCAGDHVIRVGQGWGPSKRRQTLPDWHSDKLAALDRRCCIVSALENTHFNSYISEKLFDAFAVVSLPLYFASAKHRVHSLVPESSYVNLFDCPADMPLEPLIVDSMSKSALGGYREAQSLLAKQFSDPSYLIAERHRVVSQIEREFESLA